MKQSRLTVVLGVLSVASMALAGCVRSTGGTEASQSQSPGEKVNLTFSSSAFQPGTIQATTDIVNAWNAAHPDIHVEYQKVSPDGAHDKLVTQFAGNSAPDIIQNEAADNAGFSRQGYLADLTTLIPSGLKSDIPDTVWDAATIEGKVTGVPYMTQVYAVFVNKKLLDRAGIEIPKGAGNGWTWEQLQANAKKLTKPPTYGFGWGLKQPAQGIVSTSLAYDGTFFSGGEDGKPDIHVGDNEMQIPKRLHSMLFDDKSMTPSSVSLGGGEMMPGFLGGRYAMFMAGNYVASEIGSKAPSGFEWSMLPLMKGTSDHQAANPQTFSIARQSKHPKEAMQFIEFVMQAKNVAALAMADSLIPVSRSAAKVMSDKIGQEHGWDALINSADSLVNAPAYQANKFTDWKVGVANPSYQEYLGGRINDEGLKKRLTDGWNRINK